jgi:hypothetical protein
MKIDPNIYWLLEIVTLLAAVAQLWTLIGLLIWLVLYGEQRRKNRFVAFFVTLLCGPAAFIVAAWTVANRRPVLVQAKTVLPGPWELPNGRN